MSSGAAVTGGLRAALLLALGRPDGLLRVRDDRAGVAASFWAAAFCLPPYVALRWMDWRLDWPGHPGHAGVVELIAYVVGWAGYAVASHPLAVALDEAARWPRFIAAWNWCKVAQYVLLLLSALPGLAGAPDWVDQTAGLVALFWAIWLEWYVARIALDIPRWPAAAFVALDVGLDVVLTALTALFS